MKKLMMILLAAGMVSVASAQHVRVGGGFGGYRGGYAVRGYAPAIGFGFYPGLYWGFGYPYYGYPYGYPNGRVPSKLQMQVSDIKADYADRIASVKSDNTLSGKEKRQQVRALKHERDNAVANTVHNYWKTPAPSAPAPAQAPPNS